MNMETIRVHASRDYEIRIGRGIAETIGTRIKELSKASCVMVVTDESVASLYGERVKENLHAAGFRTEVFTFPAGEDSKSIPVYASLLEALHAKRLTRSDLIVALGGGVTGDMAGFAAATYLRGIDYIQIPTTLLAAVDSSVGGKTAVNLEGGKNLAGAFYQPLEVLIDPDLLSSLPERDFKAGCAEVIKYAVIGDAEFFEELSATPVMDQIEHVIATCVKMKRDIVETDEFDRGNRMLLNFGHTFGHAAERVSGYDIRHGEAVAMGMCTVTKAAEKRGIAEKGTYEKLTALLEKTGLQTAMPYPANELYDAMFADKKRSGETFRLIVPRKIGQCEIMKVPASEIKEWLTDGGVG